MIAYSILDLVRVTQDTDARGAIDNARNLAASAETWGYTRFWVAEHHNTVGIASAATSLVLGHIAAGTRHIRVGAGGIMLPNHAPLIIAEQFGTLAQLHPGRIDLGVGRASGTDPLTVRALRRPTSGVDSFPQDILEIQAYFSDAAASQAIQAVPAAGTNVPIWILGSSHYGAQLAAELGLPYAFASHFSPDMLLSALKLYRGGFQPSPQLARPRVMIGVNIIAADTTLEAHRIATTQQMSFTDVFRGHYGLSKPPIHDIDTYWSSQERAWVSQTLKCSIIGDADDVSAGVQALLSKTGADELMIVSDVYHHHQRLQSFEIVAAVMRELNLSAH